MTWLSIHDVRYREFKSYTPIWVGWIISIIGGLIKFGLSWKILIGFCLIIVPFYLFELVVTPIICQSKDAHVIGGIDVLAGPIYTIWFGNAPILIAIGVFISVVVFGFPFVRKSINRFYRGEGVKEDSSIPMLLYLQIAFMVALLITKI